MNVVESAQIRLNQPNPLFQAAAARAWKQWFNDDLSWKQNLHYALDYWFWQREPGSTRAKVTEFDPGQLVSDQRRISADIVTMYCDGRLKMAPVNVAVIGDLRIIKDGNHRAVASQILGQPVRAFTADANPLIQAFEKAVATGLERDAAIDGLIDQYRRQPPNS